MQPTPELLRRLASESGSGANILEKVIRLGDLAGDVGRHPFLGRVLALEGGTALNLRLDRPPRLSVDLDFNYVGSVEREGMLQDRPRVEQGLAELASRKGYRVQASRDEHAGRKLYLRYASAAGPEDRIEVDLNFLFRQPLSDIREGTLWQPGGLDRPRLAFVSREEVVVGKLLALLDRTAVRDAFDVMRLTETSSVVLEAGTLRPLFVALAATLPLPLTSYSREHLDRITEEMAAVQLRDTLVRGTTVGAAEQTRYDAWVG